MSSGEVLFILAFIVLPTTVLVSSIWAIVFVRRQPDRIAADSPTEVSLLASDDDVPRVEDTALISTITVNDNGRRRESLESHDVDLAADEPEDEPVDGSLDDIAAITTTADMPVEHEPHEPPAQDDAADAELDVPQTTDDLDQVVAGVAARETEEEPEEPRQELEDEAEPTIFQTTELPVVKRPEPADQDPETVMLDHQQATESHTEGQPVDRRRKPLLPRRSSDADVPRGRGRNRDPQRQVPQLGRFSRRRDSAHRNAPVNTDTDPNHESPQDHR